MKAHKVLHPSDCSGGLGLAAYAYAPDSGSSRAPWLIPYEGPVSQNGAVARGPWDLGFHFSPLRHCGSPRRWSRW